jgi:hypothetical protein
MGGVFGPYRVLSMRKNGQAAKPLTEDRAHDYQRPTAAASCFQMVIKVRWDCFDQAALRSMMMRCSPSIIPSCPARCQISIHVFDE